MKEYTFLALFSVIFTFFVDQATRVKIFKRFEFYIFLAIIFGFKLIVNGYLTGEKIVIYAPRFFLGFRITSIPLEDFLFGGKVVDFSPPPWQAAPAA